MNKLRDGRSGDGSRMRHFHIRTTGDISVAVMIARSMAREIGLNKKDEFQVGTAVSELATNVVRYAEKGEVRLQVVERKGNSGLEIIVEDKGPGIPDLDSVLKDHFSTHESLGLGLPSVKRMMDEFTMVSNVGQGTRATIRKWTRMSGGNV
jgi:serine/threonine-protein kinase RsbT